jgi:hypothetical protein
LMCFHPPKSVSQHRLLHPIDDHCQHIHIITVPLTVGVLVLRLIHSRYSRLIVNALQALTR